MVRIDDEAIRAPWYYPIAHAMLSANCKYKLCDALYMIMNRGTEFVLDNFKDCIQGKASNLVAELLLDGSSLLLCTAATSSITTDIAC